MITENDVEESRLTQLTILSLNFSGRTQQKHTQKKKKKTAVVAAEIRTTYLLNTSEKGYRFSHDARWNSRGITKYSSVNSQFSSLHTRIQRKTNIGLSPSHTVQVDLSDHISLALHILYEFIAGLSV